MPLTSSSSSSVIPGSNSSGCGRDAAAASVLQSGWPCHVGARSGLLVLSFFRSVVEQGRSSLPLPTRTQSLCLWPSVPPSVRRPQQRELIICHDEGYFELYQFRHHVQSYGMNAVPGTKFSIISNVILRGSKITGILLSIRSCSVCSRRIPSCYPFCSLSSIPSFFVLPPTPFGAMMPSTHSSSGEERRHRPLPSPLPNAERPTDAIIPPWGRGNENHHQVMSS